MRFLILVFAIALGGSAYAQHHHGHGTGNAKTHSGVGVVKSVDAAKGTVMLAHEPIASLQWPKMTMKFVAGDRKMLDQLAPGKKIEFEFVERNRDYVLTRLK